MYTYKLTRAGVSQSGAAGHRAHTSALTGLRLTHAEPALTPPAGEAGLADTQVVVGQLDAVQAVGGAAGVGETLVYVSLASFSGESRGTVAAVSAHSVHTGAVVQALGRSTTQPQGWSAVVFVDLTENTFKRRRLLNISIY